ESDDVVPTAHDGLPPLPLDVLLELGAQGPVVPCRPRTAVDLTGLEDKASALGECDDVIESAGHGSRSPSSLPRPGWPRRTAKATRVRGESPNRKRRAPARLTLRVALVENDSHATHPVAPPPRCRPRSRAERLRRRVRRRSVPGARLDLPAAVPRAGDRGRPRRRRIRDPRGRRAARPRARTGAGARDRERGRARVRVWLPAPDRRCPRLERGRRRRG